MFMKNGIILSIADRIKDALPIPTDEFRKRLEEDCYVIWKLPHFDAQEITQTPVVPSYADYVESKMQRYMALIFLHIFRPAYGPSSIRAKITDIL